MQRQAIVDHIVNWLTDCRDRSGLHGFVVGVSGGVDSAVTSTLCALTGEPVMVLNMPIHQAADRITGKPNHSLSIACAKYSRLARFGVDSVDEDAWFPQPADDFGGHVSCGCG